MILFDNRYISISKLKALQDSIGFLNSFSFHGNIEDGDFAYVTNQDLMSDVNLEATELLNKLGMLNDERNKIINQILSMES